MKDLGDNLVIKNDNVIKLVNYLIENFERRFTDFTKIQNYIKLISDPFSLGTVPEEYHLEVISLQNDKTVLNTYRSSTNLNFTNIHLVIFQNSNKMQ